MGPETERLATPELVYLDPPEPAIALGDSAPAERVHPALGDSAPAERVIAAEDEAHACQHPQAHRLGHPGPLGGRFLPRIAWLLAPLKGLEAERCVEPGST